MKDFTGIGSRSLGVHDGSFHADEVTACSLLLLFDLVDKDKVTRTRDLSVLSRCDFVCDVGGIYDPEHHRFDHHQIDYQGAMSSAGMVLLYLKDRKTIDPHLYDAYNRILVMGVDAHDNGVAKMELGTTSFSQVISNFLPIRYDATISEMNKAFFHAVDFAFGHLDRMRKRFAYNSQCQSLVKEAMKNDSIALIFEESIPWMESFFEAGGEFHPAEFVIMPTSKHWKLRGVPPSMNERMKVRCPLPLSWSGLLDDDLKKASGIEGAIFCHKGRFISIWETKEDALIALNIVLKEGKKK